MSVGICSGGAPAPCATMRTKSTRITVACIPQFELYGRFGDIAPCIQNSNIKHAKSNAQKGRLRASDVSRTLAGSGRPRTSSRRPRRRCRRQVVPTTPNTTFLIDRSKCLQEQQKAEAQPGKTCEGSRGGRRNATAARPPASALRCAASAVRAGERGGTRSCGRCGGGCTPVRVRAVRARTGKDTELSRHRRRRRQRATM